MTEVTITDRGFIDLQEYAAWLRSYGYRPVRFQRRGTARVQLEELPAGWHGNLLWEPLAIGRA